MLCLSAAAQPIGLRPQDMARIASAANISSGGGGGGGGGTMPDLVVFVSRGLTNDTTDRSTYLTAPATDYIQSNTLALAMVVNSKASAPDAPTLSGMGLNWVQIGTSNFNTLASPTERVTVFRAMSNNIASGRLTADFGGATQTSCLIDLVQAFGAGTNGTDGADGLVQTNYGGGNADTTLTITLGALNANGTNGAIGFYGNNLNPFGGAAESGWTEGLDYGVATPNTGGGIYWRQGTTDNTIGPSVSSSAWAGIGVEVKANTIAANSSPVPDIQWYRFVDGGGTYVTAHKGVAGTSDGTWIAGPSAGSHGMSFDGAGQEGASVNTIGPGTNKISVSFWAKFNDTSTTQVALESSVNYNGSPSTWVFYVDAGTLNFGLGGNTSGVRLETITAPATGSWHNYLCVYDNSTSAGDLIVYQDGVLQSTTLTTSTHSGSGNLIAYTLYWGARNNGGSFRYNGSLSDVRIYSGDQSAIASTLYSNGAQ